LLGLGAGVEVLAPSSLREQIAAQARAVADRYR
jgi:predicted DNA-binding transcriptional regulator YafY